MFKKLILASALVVSVGAYAENKSESSKEQTLSQMSLVYSKVNVMTDAEFSSMMEKGASILEGKNQTQKAAALRAIANVPGARESFAKRVQKNMESQSSNGIFFIIYLLSPGMWCEYGDMTCVIPVTVLSLITFDGETASDI